MGVLEQEFTYLCECVCECVGGCMCVCECFVRLENNGTVCVYSKVCVFDCVCVCV